MLFMVSSHGFDFDFLSTLCLKKNDNDVLCYNFKAHQPILIIFGRDIAEEYAIK